MLLLSELSSETWRFGHSQARDRARQAVAEFHRDPLQHPAQDGRLALCPSRELGRASPGARALRRRLQRPGALCALGARRLAPVACGGPRLRLRGAPPRGGAASRLLLGALRQGPGLFGLHALSALAGLRRGGARREGGGKALRLEGYAPRAPRRPPALQEALFPYAEAL